MISIAKQLLGILDYLHHRQPAVIHRDIKPSNILLGDRSGNSPGQVYLVDFGSVKTAANGSTITIVGTYGYMPPEQFGGHTSPASDLYALGATMICLTTGRHPSELPHRDMQIDFVDLVNLSSGLTNWLKSLTEISVDSRLKSASAALLALTAPNRREILTFQRPPFGSRIRLIKTDRVIEISTPSKGLSLGLILLPCGLSVFWDSIVSLFTFANLTTFARGGLPMLLFISPFAWFGISMIWGIVFDLFGTRKLRIDESEISLSLAIFGLICSTSQTAPRQYLDRVELVPLTYTNDAEGDRVPVPPYLNIWAGNKRWEHPAFYCSFVE